MSNIEIQLFRVSANSKYLDMIFSCDPWHYFDSLQLQIQQGEELVSLWYDLSPALFDITISPTCTVLKRDWTISIPLEALNVSGPAIYTATLKVQPLYNTIINTGTYRYALPVPYNDSDIYQVLDPETGQVYNMTDPENPELVYWEGTENPVTGYILDICEEIPMDEQEDTAICSDVNFVYRCLLDGILEEGPCDPVSDEIIRKYLILYGHETAMKLRHLETAERYFKYLAKCFHPCNLIGNIPVTNKPCNCH